MGKIFFGHFGWGLLANLIIAVISLIFTLIVTVLLGAFTGPVLPMIAGIIGGGILGVIASGIIITFKNKTYLKGVWENKFEKLWYAISVEKKKKIGMGKIFLMLLPFLAIAAVLAFFAVKQYPIAAKVVLMNRENNTPNGILIVLLVVLLMNSAIFWFLYFCFLLGLYGSSRCKCGGVMCFTHIETEDYNTDTYVDTKTKDAYGTIGEVYEGNKKIGEIKGTTGSYSLERERLVSSWTCVCRCVFCGNEKKIRDNSTTIINNWH